jgi:hypothetical protein
MSHSEITSVNVLMTGSVNFILNQNKRMYSAHYLNKIRKYTLSNFPEEGKIIPPTMYVYSN